MEIIDKNIKFKPGLIPWFIIRLSIFITLYTAFGYWAVNAESLGKHNLGVALFFGFTAFIAFYGTMAMAFISLILTIIYNVNNKKGVRVLLYAFLINISPISCIALQSFIQ